MNWIRQIHMIRHNGRMNQPGYKMSNCQLLGKNNTVLEFRTLYIILR